MRIIAVALACALTGCVSPEFTPCGELVCGAEQACVNERCVDEADLRACEGLAEGSPCGDAGVCRGEVCVVPRCGDGVIDDGEVCDDANTTSGDGCNGTCTSQEECGDGRIELAELCDCGDGVRAGGPACDGTANGGTVCRVDCTPARCGNGLPDPGEACDDGNTASGDGCAFDCRSEACGDGFIDFARGEECDDGDLVSGDGCQDTCLLPVCGDNVVDDGEVCDDGGTASGDGCDETCTSEETCGNAIVDVGEGCDCGDEAFAGERPALCNGLPNSAERQARCRETCALAGCGDGVIVSPEVCEGADLQFRSCADFGFYQGDLACDQTCTFDTQACAGRCGDGMLQDAFEQCDGVIASDSCLAYGADAGSVTCSSCTISVASCDELGWRREAVLDATQIEPRDADSFWLVQNYRLYTYDIATRQTSEVPLPDGVQLADRIYARGGDLYLVGFEQPFPDSIGQQLHRLRNGVWLGLYGGVDSIYQVTVAGDEVYFFTFGGFQRWTPSGDEPIEDPIGFNPSGPLTDDRTRAWAVRNDGALVEFPSGAVVATGYESAISLAAGQDSLYALEAPCRVRRVADDTDVFVGSAGLTCSRLRASEEGHVALLSSQGALTLDGTRFVAPLREPVVDVAFRRAPGAELWGVNFDLHRLLPNRWEGLVARSAVFQDVAIDRRSPAAPLLVVGGTGLATVGAVPSAPQTMFGATRVCSTPSRVYVASPNVLRRCSGSWPLSCTALPLPFEVPDISCSATQDTVYLALLSTPAFTNGVLESPASLGLGTPTAVSARPDGALVALRDLNPGAIPADGIARYAAGNSNVVLSFDGAVDAIHACDDTRFLYATRNELVACELPLGGLNATCTSSYALPETTRILRITGPCENAWAVARDRVYQREGARWEPVRTPFLGNATSGVAVDGQLVVAGAGEVARLRYDP